MADTVIENLITKLSFEFDSKQLEKFDKLVEKGVKSLTVLAATATTAAVGIFTFTSSISESNDQLNRFAQTIGVDIEALQELGFVAALNKGSIESMNSSLESFSKLISETSRGIGGGVEAFGILGLSVTESNGQLKEAETLLLEVADSISKLETQAERLEFANRLGFSSDLILTLQQGSEAILKQRKEAKELGFVIDKKGAKAAENFADELLRVTKIIKGVSNTIATKFMKEIAPMMKAFVNWFKANKALIQQNFSSFVEKAITIFRTFLRLVSRVVGVVNTLVSSMGGWENSIIAITGLLIVMNAHMLLTPFLALLAAAGLLLVIEDIQKFAEGGDSALGDLAKRIPEIDALLRTTLDLLNMSKEGWVLLFTEGDAAFEGMMLWLKDLRSEFNLLDGVLRFISDLFSEIINGWRLLFTEGDTALLGLKLMILDLGKAFEKYLLTPIKITSNLMDKMTDFKLPNIDEFNLPSIFDFKLPNIDKLSLPSILDFKFPSSKDFNLPGIRDIKIPSLPNFINRASVAGERASSTTTNNTTNKPTNIINIHGGNLAEVKRVVSDVLTEQYSSAQTNLESQVGF